MRLGSGDGLFRGDRYFLCAEDCAAFLTVNNIISVTPSTTASPIPTTSGRKLLLSQEMSKTAQDFYLNDEVVVFDKEGRRVPGVVKWAAPGKEFGLSDYIIGIETVRMWVHLSSLNICEQRIVGFTCLVATMDHGLIHSHISLRPPCT